MRVSHRHQSLNTRMVRENPDAAMAALAKHRGECTVLTGTEGQNEAVLKAPGWGVFREEGPFNRDDPWISWATDIWQKREGSIEELSSVTYEGRRAHAAVLRLRHMRLDNRVTFIVPHMPAHIARLLDARRSSPQERAWVESLDTLRDLVRDVRRNNPHSAVVLVGDLNVSVKMPSHRRRLEIGLRGTGLHMVPIPRDVGGTLGPRLVDWAFSDLTSSGDVLARTDASDHRGVAFTHED